MAILACHVRSCADGTGDGLPVARTVGFEHVSPDPEERRGFVEKYLYMIADDYIGQQVDDNGYLYVDEDAWVVQTNAFHGEVHEEYDEFWATAASGYRFGRNTDSFSYRYFMSNLRLVQMRVNYVHSEETLIPHLLPWVSQQLGRTVEDTPEVWSYLNTSYLFRYAQLKNFERWLYQRDSPGYETVPVEPINNEPIGLWMVRENIDHMAKRGQKFGFAIDDRFISREPTPVAVKVSYLDQTSGTLTLNYSTPGGSGQKSIELVQDGKLKTATFIINDLIAPAQGLNYDLTFSATEEAVLSFVRVIKLTYPEDYLAFAQRYGLTQGPLGDDDGDGVSNFAEYAFGGNPLDPRDQGHQPTFSVHGGEIISAHVRRRESSLSPDYRFEWSNDLLNWTTDGLPDPQTQAKDDVFEEMSIRVPMSETVPLFFRSIAEQ